MAKPMLQKGFLKIILISLFLDTLDKNNSLVDFIIEYSKFDFDPLYRPYESRKTKLNSSYDGQSFDARAQWCLLI